MLQCLDGFEIAGAKGGLREIGACSYTHLDGYMRQYVPFMFGPPAARGKRRAAHDGGAFSNATAAQL